mgnify:CR=1 FL=1
MTNTRENLLKMSKLAVQSPRIGKRGKSFATLAQEQVREEYLNKLRSEFDIISDVHVTAAKKERNAKERMYAIDKLAGKAADNVQHTGADGGPIKVESTIISQIDKVYGEEQEK